MVFRNIILMALCLKLMSCAPTPLASSNIDSEAQLAEKSAVIGGEMVSVLQSKAAHAVVGIELLNQHREVVGLCTGVLIGANTVLSAAHCFNEALLPGVSAFNIVFGTHMKFQGNQNLRTGYSYKTHLMYNTQKKTWIAFNGKYVETEKHPELQASGGYLNSVPDGDHDLAVLVFRGVRPSGYEPVKIDLDIHANYAGKTVYFYGFGRANDYSRANYFTDTSTGWLRKGNGIVDQDFDKYPDRYFISKKSKNSLCQGDSGGPQFYNENGVLKIIGINSAVSADETSLMVTVDDQGKQMLSCLNRSQIAKVAAYASWILNTQDELLKQMQDQAR